MLPAAVEISFYAMSPQAARTVMSVSSSANDWMDTTTPNYQRLIAPHAYQFRSRINCHEGSAKRVQTESTEYTENGF